MLTNASTTDLDTTPTQRQSAPSLPVVETFHSIQGEGTWTGTNAFFIRLGGCNVGCPWCDTKESWNARRHPKYQIKDLVTAAVTAHPRMVVITGGEPLMHNLDNLTHGLRASGLQVHLETSGAYPFSGQFDWVTFSPKRFKPPHESIYAHVNELKVVVAEPADLEWAALQATKIPSDAARYLQPEWTTANSRKLVINHVLSYPDWRISLQTHKVLGVI